MIYFDKEKGEYVWLQARINKDYSIDRVGNKKYLKSICFLCIAASHHSEEDIRFIEEKCKERNIPFKILPNIPNNTEEHIRYALCYLNSEEAKSQDAYIKQGYDYAWIKRVIDKNLFIGATKVYNKSYPSFIYYIKKLGFENIASPTVLSKYYNKVNDRDDKGSLPWEYVDCINDRNEANRRNNIASVFLEIMTEYTY